MTLNNKIKNSLLTAHQNEELEAIEKWKKQLHENADELIAHLESSKITEQLRGYQTVDSAAAWDKVSSRIPELSVPDSAKVLRPKFINAIWKIAAVIILVIGAYIGFKQLDTTPTVFESQLVEVITMNDGSNITLDEGTKLVQLADRAYNLEGRAYFRVAKDPKHPFTVKTLHGQLTVLGTEFNIWTTDQSTHVAVTEGTVRFVWLDKEYILTRGDVLVSNSKGANITHIDKMGYDSWKDKSLKFKDDNLHFVLQNIAVFYKINLVFSDESEFDSCKINSIFREETIDQVLKELNVLAGLDYDFDGQTITAKSFNCN